MAEIERKDKSEAQGTDSGSRWVQVITKIIEMTQDGKLTWMSRNPPHSLQADNSTQKEYAEVVFETSFKGKTLRLYELHFYYEPPANLSGFHKILEAVGTQLKPHWETRPVLELLDENGLSVFTFPYVAGLKDLLIAVKYQTAGVYDLIEDILAG